MPSSEPSPILFNVEEGVARLTLNRPEVFNALDFDTLELLAECALEATLDDQVGAILITGAGKAFSAGGDVRALSALASSEAPSRDAMKAIGRMHEAMITLFRCPKPVVAAVIGATAGAGLGLMMTADLIWAARSAHFTVAFTAIGASPDGGTTFLLPRLVGPKLAAELVLTNRRLGAEEALAAGLVSQVLDDESLLARAEDTARRLAAGPSGAFASAKELMRRSVYRGYEAQLEEERRIMGRSVAGAEFKEGVQAFLEKRAPRFGR